MEAGVTLGAGHFPEDQLNVLRAVALAYRRVMRAPTEPAVTRAEIARRDQSGFILRIDENEVVWPYRTPRIYTDRT
jgi:hypothetical protein